jgi:Leucine-rich repeat (LRR) protein
MDDSTPPQSVEVELVRRTAEGIESKKKHLYVTEVNGTVTLDLYSGWALEGEEHKYKLENLPIKVCSFSTLQKLWLSHNNLSGLPVQIDQLVNLKELFLHHNSLKSIPVRAFNLSKLEILWVSSNRLQEVHPDISKLTRLRQLHLEHNKLKEYQEALNDLPSLEVLYLNHNELTSISTEIYKLSKILRRLYLHNNKLSSIPDTICSLTLLETLHLQFNEILHVPRNFESFCHDIEANNKAIVNVSNNAYIVPRSRVKLSVGGAPPNVQSLQIQQASRRHSDHGGPSRERSATDGDKYNARSCRYSVPSGGHIDPLSLDSKTKSATLNR